MALRGVQWTVARSTLAVAALNLLLLLVVMQQHCVVLADNATHVGHTLVGNINCILVEKFSEWVALGEG